MWANFPMAIKLQIWNLAEPSCGWLQSMQPHRDNTSKRILLKTSAPVSRAMVGVWHLSLADGWRLITDWLELIQPGLTSLGLFALLHLSKGKRREVSIITVLLEAVRDFCSTARKMNWPHLSETPSGIQFSLRSERTRICWLIWETAHPN